MIVRQRPERRSLEELGAAGTAQHREIDPDSQVLRVQVVYVQRFGALGLLELVEFVLGNVGHPGKQQPVAPVLQNALLQNHQVSGLELQGDRLIGERDAGVLVLVLFLAHVQLLLRQRQRLFSEPGGLGLLVLPHLLDFLEDLPVQFLELLDFGLLRRRPCPPSCLPSWPSGSPRPQTWPAGRPRKAASDGTSRCAVLWRER